MLRRVGGVAISSACLGRFRAAFSHGLLIQEAPHERQTTEAADVMVSAGKCNPRPAGVSLCRPHSHGVSTALRGPRVEPATAVARTGAGPRLSDDAPDAGTATVYRNSVLDADASDEAPAAQIVKQRPTRPGPLLVFLPGARTTSMSLQMLRWALIDRPAVLLDYATQGRFADRLQALIVQLQEAAGRRPLFFVGHSLGGIYAVHLAHHFAAQTCAGVTLATPYGGVPGSWQLKRMDGGNSIWQDLVPTAWAVRSAQALPLACPWTQVVATAGHTRWLRGPNDGVVTVASQRARKCEQIALPVNHYAVLMHPRVVSIIRSRLWATQ